jgi:hypothetical protein
MSDHFHDSEFNPLHEYPNIPIIPLDLLTADPTDGQGPVQEAGEPEYLIISDYAALPSPKIKSEVKASPKLETEVDCHIRSQIPQVETKKDTTDHDGPNMTSANIGGSQKNEIQASQGSEQFPTQSMILINLNSFQQTNKMEDQVGALQVVVDDGYGENSTYLKPLPPVPPVSAPPVPPVSIPLFSPFTPMINPLTTLLPEKHLKVDEYDQSFSDDSNHSSNNPSLNFKERLKEALGSLTIDNWRGDDKSKKSYLLLILRLLFMIYALGILIFRSLDTPASEIFRDFNIWSWIIMLLWLILSIYVSFKVPKITFGLSCTGIILYLFFATYSLCTPIPLIIQIVGETPVDAKSWILDLSFGSFGLIVLFSELFLNRIDLSNALLPIFIAGNSLIWASLFGINASIYGNIGEAFPWMSSNIIPGAILCLTFPVLLCWICINGCRN